MLTIHLVLGDIKNGYCVKLKTVVTVLHKKIIYTIKSEIHDYFELIEQ